MGTSRAPGSRQVRSRPWPRPRSAEPFPAHADPGPRTPSQGGLVWRQDQLLVHQPLGLVHRSGRAGGWWGQASQKPALGAIPSQQIPSQLSITVIRDPAEMGRLPAGIPGSPDPGTPTRDPSSRRARSQQIQLLDHRDPGLRGRRGAPVAWSQQIRITRDRPRLVLVTHPRPCPSRSSSRSP